MPSSTRRARPHTIATSERSSSEAGLSRPREACTILIESSTETTCSPEACTSRSLRASVGRISAWSPVTRCERFSLVDTWTVSRMPRNASAVTSVSGAARRKLPPSAMNTCARPARIAWMLFTTSKPGSRGGSKPNASLSRSRKAAVGRSLIPIVRSPCTLLWPRTGQSPAPRRPMLPRSRRKFAISRIVATALRCCVSPIAQQTMIRSDSAASAAARSISARARPVAYSTSGHESASRSRRSSSKPSQWDSTKSRSTASASRISRFNALKSARSPFTRTWRKRSESSVPRPISPRAVCGFLNRISPGSGSGFTVTIRAPFRLAASSAVSMRGWFVPGFWPTTKIRSAASMSSSDTLPLPTPSTSVSASLLDS